jgi:hypothetical protein
MSGIDGMINRLAPKRFGAGIGYFRLAGDPGKDFRAVRHAVLPFRYCFIK